jgi:hypothetical protein
MARKSKHMALNDAIRQGQAKIANGLKTGQMKSDGSSALRAEKGKADLPSPENVIQNPVGKCRAFFLKSKEKSVFWGQFPPKMKLIALLCAASIAVLALGIWLIFLIGDDQSPNMEPQGTPVVNIVPEENEQTEKKFRLPGFGSRDSSDLVDTKDPEMEPLAPLSSGDNVIWIQSIVMSRKGELDSLKIFFRSKGIQTEIVEISGSNLAVLMTQDSFDGNPSVAGTEGYELLERIKQLGLVYVKETEDTKFGLRPFQDAFVYKRQ